MAFEAARTTDARAGILPQLEPAIHAQVRLEIAQWPLQQLAFGIAEHRLRRLVGIAHVAVPVDPENAHGALVDGELAQAQRLFTALPLAQILSRGRQPVLDLQLLTTLPH